MTEQDPLAAAAAARTLSNAAGLGFEINANGSIGRITHRGVVVNLFPGNELEGGPANLWLRLRGGARADEATPLLGPLSPLLPQRGSDGWLLAGTWHGLHLRVELRLSASEPAWFWHVQVANRTDAKLEVDLVWVQDVGLSSHGAIRTNEYYVSHYVDLTPLEHARHGWVVAARQNQAVAGRHPWALFGSLRRGSAHATDALQVYGLASRAGMRPAGIEHGLPGRRLQHEHAAVAIQDAPLSVAPGEREDAGFFGRLLDHHPDATGELDLALVDAALALPEARAPVVVPVQGEGAVPVVRTLYAGAPLLQALDLDAGQVDALFGRQRRHEEHDRDGTLLSFFHGGHAHVVLRAKELRVHRPHGHLLRSGARLVPDEAALTSTVWMNGVFHSMLTQGHVSINRFLSTVRSWLGLFRSHGQRVFVRIDRAWQQLGVPSAFEIEPAACRWIYRHPQGLIEVRSAAVDAPHAMTLQVRSLDGRPLELLVTHHVALGGDDGAAPAVLPVEVERGAVVVGVPPGSELAARFPSGSFRIEPADGSRFARVGGDELLYDDGRSRGQPFVCIASDPAPAFGLSIVGRLIDDAAAPAVEGPVTLPTWTAPAASPLAADAARLSEIVPWYLHNALVHYLSPRGLEQYSGGGWGTRDVCQGPLEMLLALGRVEPVRDLLLRVYAAQNPDGDWPQWFMFFDRERDIRAGDSHGDIVFWPLLGLARYLIASGDAALLDEPVPFHAASGAERERAPLRQHVERALAVIQARRIAGTHLAAYGHGDWNDSLQPADPSLREHLCSAWTVTLHHQMLAALARALRVVGHASRADALDADAAAVQADFRRLLVGDGVVTGYALFRPGEPPQRLLHPDDRLTGVRYSLLPMMHAVLEDLLSPEQARAQLDLIEAHLLGPDGARLFDAPLPYRGGPQRLFQRAESSAFFGREIGVMYMHAHLRYAEMLAHLGEAERFLDALARAHPVGLAARVPSASLRQANCYYSSSDAAFADRYEAQRDYARVAAGTVALDGGWRVYSSGPGIAIGLVGGCLLGLRCEHSTLVVDPVMPAALDGLRARVPLAGGGSVDVSYRVGAAGCGPTRIELDGAALPFSRRHNPYRSGAAELPMAEFRARLARGAGALVVHVG